MVGPNPRRSTTVRITTAHIDSDVKYQNGKEDIAKTKNNQSIFVMEISERFKNASNAINIDMHPENPIAQAPAPPLSSSCARNTTKVVVPQMTQENTCGLRAPLMMERI